MTRIHSTGVEQACGQDEVGAVGPSGRKTIGAREWLRFPTRHLDSAERICSGSQLGFARGQTGDSQGHDDQTPARLGTQTHLAPVAPWVHFLAPCVHTACKDQQKNDWRLQWWAVRVPEATGARTVPPAPRKGVAHQCGCGERLVVPVEAAMSCPQVDCGVFAVDRCVTSGNGEGLGSHRCFHRWPRGYSSLAGAVVARPRGQDALAGTRPLARA